MNSGLEAHWVLHVFAQDGTYLSRSGPWVGYQITATTHRLIKRWRQRSSDASHDPDFIMIYKDSEIYVWDSDCITQFQGKGEVFWVFISWLLCVFVCGGGGQLYYSFLAASWVAHFTSLWNMAINHCLKPSSQASRNSFNTITSSIFSAKWVFTVH